MEKLLYFMDVYTLTQGYGLSSYSHKYGKQLDFGGENTGIDKVYAPFTGIIRKIYTGSNAVWLESKGEVLCADGKARKLVFLTAHCNDISHLKVGMEIKQGQYYYSEGTKGASANHVHVELGMGPFSGSGWNNNNPGKEWTINNPIAMEKYMMLKDDVVIKKYTYQGKEYLMKKVSEVFPVSANKTLYLPKEATSWRVYPLDKQPRVGNECGKLNPSKFGGLTYDILNMPYPDVATIKTRDYGTVNIYVAKSTGAIIK